MCHVVRILGEAELLLGTHVELTLGVAHCESVQTAGAVVAGVAEKLDSLDDGSVASADDGDLGCAAQLASAFCVKNTGGFNC